MVRSVIKLEDVWKTYQMGDVKVDALRHLQLDIKEGEFVAIMGPSGSGKSTAMNMVGALDIPTKGRILLDGKDISHLSESDLAQVRGKKIGFIFQQFNLIPTLTALENVMLPMTFQGMPSEERAERATQLLEMVGLGDRVDHKPTELSGGQQQRVAIARSLANDPEVVLADEPTGNLDSKTEHVIMDFLNRLHNEKCKTIVMVTHDEGVANHAERIEFLRDGEIVRTYKGKKHKHVADAPCRKGSAQNGVFSSARVAERLTEKGNLPTPKQPKKSSAIHSGQGRKNKALKKAKS